ncbi:MAG: serine/threonine protein kinase, partial [Alphaproteobacteria bacterium]|nr:serine/threonine protein kinase [Alphaproteobacteria bacterium]
MSSTAAALAQAEQLRHQGRVREALERLDELGPPPEGRGWGDWASLRADLLRLLDEDAAARDQARALMGAARAQGWVDLEARALRSLALSEQRLGKLQQAEVMLERACALADGLGEPGLRARCLLARMVLLSARSDRAALKQAAPQAAALAAESGDAALITQAESWLITLRRLAGRLEEAEALARAALARPVEQIGRLLRMNAALSLGDVLLDQGRPDEAIEALALALELAESLGHADGVTGALLRLAEVKRLGGRADEAAEDLQRALAQPKVSAGDRRVLHLNLGLIEASRGRWGALMQQAELAGPSTDDLVGAVARVAALSADMGLGRFEDAGPRAEALRVELTRRPCVDPDIATLLEQGARATPADGDPVARRAALRALSLAREQRQALRDASGVSALDAELRARAGGELPLGALWLTRPLGAGGMGAVWEAFHPGEGVSVAVKVMTSEQALDDSARRALRREVEAIARLDHPHIVRVYHHGVVEPVTAMLSGGRLQAGHPYLVMELATEGTLSERCGASPWAQVQEVLVALLRALAHAHARGVMHLDLKPDNVLLTRGPEGPQVRLADFGLARAMGEGAGLRAGTPSYMAPEQIRGERLGPWTDLYGLGGLAWALVCGQPPFVGELREVVSAQLSAPLPELEPAQAVPEGLEGWLRGLLQRQPAERFAHAADALRALEALGPPVPQRARPSPRRASWSSASTFLFGVELSPEPAPMPEAPALGPQRPEGPPPLGDWRVVEHARRPRALEALGLETLGLREPPLVGREAERDALWSALRGERPRALLVTAPPG